MKDHFLPSSFSTNGNTHTSWLEFGNNYLKTAAIAILLPLALHVPTKMGGDTQSHSHVQYIYVSLAHIVMKSARILGK